MLTWLTITTEYLSVFLVWLLVDVVICSHSGQLLQYLYLYSFCVHVYSCCHMLTWLRINTEYVSVFLVWLIVHVVMLTSLTITTVSVSVFLVWLLAHVVGCSHRHHICFQTYHLKMLELEISRRCPL